MTRWLTLKKWPTLTALLLLSLWLASPAWAQGGRFWLQAIGDNNEAIVNGRCIVLTAGANTLPTIYTTASLATAASNPLTMGATSGVCEWFAAMATTAFDAILVVDSGAYKGEAVRVDNVTRTGQHTVRVNRSGGLKRLFIPYPSAAASTATTDSRTLPAGAQVTYSVLWTTTAVVGSSLAVGHGADGAEANICSGRAPIGAGTALTESSTGSVGFSWCAASAIGVPRQIYTAAASGAIRIHNQSHLTAGFAIISYTPGANEP